MVMVVMVTPFTSQKLLWKTIFVLWRYGSGIWYGWCSWDLFWRTSWFWKRFLSWVRFRHKVRLDHGTVGCRYGWTVRLDSLCL